MPKQAQEIVVFGVQYTMMYINDLFKENFFLPIMSMLLATSLNYFISAFLMVLLGYRFDLMQHMEHILFPLLLYNAIFAFPVHKFVYKICELVKEKR